MNQILEQNEPNKRVKFQHNEKICYSNHTFLKMEVYDTFYSIAIIYRVEKNFS